MRLRTKPAHTGRLNTRRRSYVKRFTKSPFLRDLAIAAVIAAYVVGLCYLASFILRHPALLIAIVVIVFSAVAWGLHEASE